MNPPPSSSAAQAPAPARPTGTTGTAGAPRTGSLAEGASARVFVGAALVAMALPLSIGVGPNRWSTVLLAVAGVAVALSAAGARASTPLSARSSVFLLALLAAANPLYGPADDTPLAYSVAIAVSAALAVVLIGVHAGAERDTTRRRALAVILLLRLCVLVAAPSFVPRPPIDVWQLNQSGIDALLHGSSPYSTPMPDTYGGRATFGHQAFYPYPPLNLIASVPSFALFGDYRYGLIAALAIAVLLVGRAGARAGADPLARERTMMAIALLPQLDRLILHGWTEPYLMLGVSAFAWCQLASPGGVGAMLALASLPLLKQYFAVPALMLLWLSRPRARSLGIAALLSLLAMAPLVLRDAAATVHRGLLFFVQGVSFRADSISLPGLLHRAAGWRPGVMTTLAVQIVVGAIAARGLRARGLGGHLAAAGIALGAGFLVAPQAFLNYYFLVVFVLLAAAALLPSSGAAAHAPTGDAPSPGLARLPNRLIVPAIARAIALAIAVATVVGVGTRLADYVGLCERRAGAARARIAAGEPVLDDGTRRAGPGDAIYLCTDAHCAGPLCHRDMLCVCAASGTPAGDVARGLDADGHSPAECALSDPRPSEASPGPCARALCHERY